MENKIKSLFPFGEYRKHQEETIVKIIEEFKTKKFVILEAPTGAGKSAIAITVSRYLGNAHLLSIQKILQDQYAKDFPEAAVIKGKSNYRCVINGKPCDKGECIASTAFKNDMKRDYASHLNDDECIFYHHRSDCSFYTALSFAKMSNFTLHNFHSFYYHSFHRLFDPRSLMVIDEAHKIESTFLNFISFTLTSKDIVTEIPDLKTAEEYDTFITVYYEQLTNKINDLTDTYLKTDDEIDELAELERRHKRLEIYLASREEGVEYVAEYEKKADKEVLTFKPVYIDSFTGRFFNFGTHVLLMSATILNEGLFAKNLGIDKDEYAYISLPSLFPVENRKVYITNELDLTFKTIVTGIKRIPALVERYLSEYPDVKGIIHTHTDRIMAYIKANMKSERLIYKQQFVDVDALLETHKRSKNTVIVASGFREGLDLVDDMSRFQLILKIPYVGLNDKQLRLRMKKDKGYYELLTCLNLIQAIGRSVRSETDYCVTYIVDRKFEDFYTKAQDLFPVWFKESLEREEVEVGEF